MKQGSKGKAEKKQRMKQEENHNLSSMGREKRRNKERRKTNKLAKKGKSKTEEKEKAEAEAAAQDGMAGRRGDIVTFGTDGRTRGKIADTQTSFVPTLQK